MKIRNPLRKYLAGLRLAKMCAANKAKQDTAHSLASRKGWRRRKDRNIKKTLPNVKTLQEPIFLAETPE